MSRIKPLKTRLYEKVALPDADGCMLWTGATSREGYGQIWSDGRARNAHRVAYELLAGPVPDGLQLDHLCRVRNCVNPEHLEPVTGRENTLRSSNPTALNAAKTHCLRGHPYTAENTYTDPDGNRNCRACKKVWNARYSAKRRASR